jgi:hypothetical protein
MSPLIFQVLDIYHMRWQHFFYTSSVMAIFNVAFAVWAFHPTQREFERDRALSSAFSGLPSTTSDAQRISDATQGETAKPPSNGKYSHPAGAILMSIFSGAQNFKDFMAMVYRHRALHL